jgi:hypothetical protein
MVKTITFFTVYSHNSLNSRRQVQFDLYLLVVAEDSVVVPCLCGLRQLAASAQVQQHDSCQPSQLTQPSHPPPAAATLGSHHSHSHSTNYAHVKSSKQKIPEKKREYIQYAKWVPQRRKH